MLLSINLDHIATIRNARGGNFPSLIEAGKIVQKLGCCGITFHLREDRRHIQDQDVADLFHHFKGSLLLNFEAANTNEMEKIILQYQPDEVCLVPEKRKELTTEGGLDLEIEKHKLQHIIPILKKEGIRVSLFIDPLADNVKKAHDLGADIVELHTGIYANAASQVHQKNELLAIQDCIIAGNQLNIQVNAGHGLDIYNLESIAKLKGIHTLSIGFGVIARSVFIGLEKAIQELQKILGENDG